MSAGVLLTTFASNPSLAGGGPAWRVVHLLKAATEAPPTHYSFSAVFIDKVLRSLGDLPPQARDRKFAGLPLLHYLWPTAQYALRLRLAARGLRRGGRPLIVDAHDVPSAYIARHLLPSAPQVLTIHTIGGWVSAGFLQLRPHLQDSRAERLFRRVETSAVRRADVVVFPSDGAARLFEAAYPGILHGKSVRVVNAGLDVEAIDRVPAGGAHLQPLGIGGRRLLLCVAAHVHEKGLEVLIDAIAALPPETRAGTALVIAGRGPLSTELESRVRAKGLSDTVYLVGRVPDVIALMKAADAFVLPSRATVFDVVFLEAMAARLPVITTRIDGNLEMFGEDAAVLVPPEDPLAVRDAIVRLLENAPLRRSLAATARRRLQERFTLSKMLEGYVSVYESLTAARRDGYRRDAKERDGGKTGGKTAEQRSPV